MSFNYSLPSTNFLIEFWWFKMQISRLRVIKHCLWLLMGYFEVRIPLVGESQARFHTHPLKFRNKPISKLWRRMTSDKLTCSANWLINDANSILISPSILLVHSFQEVPTWKSSFIKPHTKIAKKYLLNFPHQFE